MTTAPVAALMATFGWEEANPCEGDPLPPLWHGLFCTAKTPPARLGSDGLPREGGLPAPVPGFPERLFGGARYRFHSPLRLGQPIRRESEVQSVIPKEGRTGPFLVALVRHRIYGNEELAIVEENDIIMRPQSGAVREDSAVDASSPAPEFKPDRDALISRLVIPDPVLMFRHSALTFNSHRVHYDRNYALGLGFPGLLVQGTLIAPPDAGHDPKRSPSLRDDGVLVPVHATHFR